MPGSAKTETGAQFVSFNFTNNLSWGCRSSTAPTPHIRAKNIGDSRNDDPAWPKWPRMNDTPHGLLNDEEPPPFTVDNAAGTSPFLIVADHAGKYLPQRLGQLGLCGAECSSHIAWDIGIGGVCRLVGTALDAVVIRQN